MASTFPNGLSLGMQSGQILDDSDVEAELEVDQLDSDTDPEEQAAISKATSKNGATRSGERVPGHTLLPAVRLENMIQADGVTGNLALSKEGLFVLSIATEEFIKRLIQAGHREASAHRRTQINYTDMAATAQQYQEFMCLCDTIPPQIPLTEALLLRREREQEDLYTDPATAAWRGPSGISSPKSEPMDAFPKPPKRSRATTNGKERRNGSDSASASRKHDGTDLAPEMRNHRPRVGSKARHESIDSYSPSGNLEWEHDNAPNGISPPGHPHNYRRPGRNGVPSASASSSLPLPLVNGSLPGISRSQSPSYSREDSLDPGSLHSQPPDPDSQSHTPNYEPGWQGRFTGPASGFLQSAVTPFGRVPQNPGRTIYSQSHHPD